MSLEILAKDTCPRRAEGPFAVEELKDGWQMKGNMLFCSYCGSLQPNMVLSLMTMGCVICPTDKNYKIYVEDKNRRYIGKFYFQHFTDEDKLRFIELYNTKPRTFGIAHPGDFYVLPFFVRREVKDDHRG